LVEIFTDPDRQSLDADRQNDTDILPDPGPQHWCLHCRAFYEKSCCSPLVSFFTWPSLRVGSGAGYGSGINQSGRKNRITRQVMVLGKVGWFDTVVPVKTVYTCTQIHIWLNIGIYDKQIYVYGQFFGNVTVVLVDLVANLCHESLGSVVSGHPNR
jgi:hypothetical protein